MEIDHDWEQIQSPFSANSINNNANPIVLKDDVFGEQSSSNYHKDSHHDEPEPLDPESQSENGSHNEPEPLDPQSQSENVSGKSTSTTKLAMVVDIADRLRKSMGHKLEHLSSIAWMAAGGSVAAFFMVLWWRRRVLAWRERCAQLESCNKKLVLVVREKDRRIDQLSRQLMRMNEVLLVRRRVPVVVRVNEVQ